MHLHPNSQWDEHQIIRFLEDMTVPMRLSFLNTENEPMICSLWFLYRDGALWSASHKSAYLVGQLKKNAQVSFEISTNDYPYKGVRGKASAELSTSNAEGVLSNLITKYLADGNTQLARWLMSRSSDEYVLKITPDSVSSWDFSDRMDNR